MANILITDRKVHYSFALITIATLTYGGYYWYKNRAHKQSPIPQSHAEKNSQANNLFQQGNALYQQGNFAQAIEKYHEAITIEPTHEQAHISTSLAAAKLNQTDHAIEHVQKALMINKNYVAGYVMLGAYLEDKKQFAEAKKAYETALSLNADLYEANIVMARLLTREGNTTAAMIHAKRAIAVQPQSKDSLVTLGDIYLVSGQPMLAREQYQTAVAKYPQAYDAYVSLGKTYEHEQQIEKAAPFYQKAIEINPNYPNGHISLAGAHFMNGNLKEGFKEYEWRWAVSNMPNLQKKWAGETVKDKTVIVLSENGLGDIIQYVRFAKLLKDKGAHIVVHTHKALESLFKQCDYIDEVIVPGQQTPAYDFVTSMQSIPYVLGIDRATLPTAAYLKADKKLSDSWHQRLAKDTHFKIGICWAPGDDSYLTADQKRTIDLTALKSLADIKGVSFYSLQKGGVTQEQIAKAPFKIASFGNDFDTVNGAFMDSAAIMKEMDLVISVDTSIAHLAGALGVPTWLLLPYAADVRWMAKTTNSIWYPSMQLFRQPKAGDWQSAVAAIKQKLQNLVKS